jgi:hypothetical protein
MTEVRYDKSHHAGGAPEARVAHRLKNSGGVEADHVIQSGSGSRRLFHNVHLSGSARQHGKENPGEGSITGGKR